MPGSQELQCVELNWKTEETKNVSSLYVEFSLRADLPSLFAPMGNSLIFQEQHPLVLGKTAIPAMRAEWRHVYGHVVGMLR